MSSQRGNVSRTRAQKHKNRHVFKNDLHDKTPQQLRLNAMHVSTVCQRCKEQIEWKIKYKKYKPLTQAKICAHCKERAVKKAYHVVCRDCAIKANACAKCLKSATEVAIEEPQPTPREEQQLQSEMDRLVKSFSERKRRAFLRYMRKGKKLEKDPNEEQLDEQQLESQEKAKRVAHTRDELLDKIKQLNLAGDGDEDEDEDDSDFDSEFDSEEEEGDDDDDSEEEPQKPATKAK